MLISVIIPAYNHLADVHTCLNSLRGLQVSKQVEYLIQDDASTEYDGRAVFCAELASVQRNETNLGFGGNCNLAAGRASGDILFFVNQDVYGVPAWSTGWDVALLDAFTAPQLGVAGGRLLFPDGSVQSAGGLYDAHCQPYHRCLGYSNPLTSETNMPRPIRWVTGAALAVRRDLFYALQGFDSLYGRGYFEDVDLCLRAELSGAEIRYVPACTLIHKVGTSGAGGQLGQNARAFYARWVKTGRIKPDVAWVKEGWW